MARALLRQPKILILDEATSALDKKTEHEIYNYLYKMADITKIIITHDWRNIRDINSIIYLENGEIKGIGNHQESFTNNEQYNYAWVKQMERKAS